jgi:hypothetical protein
MNPAVIWSRISIPLFHLLKMAFNRESDKFCRRRLHCPTKIQISGAQRRKGMMTPRAACSQ